jgi:hypothetical protein
MCDLNRATLYSVASTTRVQQCLYIEMYANVTMTVTMITSEFIKQNNLQNRFLSHLT